MKRRFLAVFLALALCLGLAPAPAFADDTPPGSGLIQLATPTGLQWGKERYWDDQGEWALRDRPGSIVWTIPEDGACQNRFDVKLYRVGEDEPVIRDRMDRGGTYDWHIFDYGGFIWDNDEADSGSWYFTVQSLGDGIDYADSEIAVSAVWDYVKPEAQMPAIPAGSLVWKTDDLPDWATGALATWTVPDSIPPWDYADTSTWTCVNVEFFFSETKDGEPEWICTFLEVGAFSNGIRIPDDDIARYGAGYYYFKVRLLGHPITEYRNGEWSELSPALDLTEITAPVKDALSDILNSDDPELDVVEAVKELDRNELRTSMLADNAVLDLIEQLEEKTGVEVSVNTGGEALPDSFKEALTEGNVKISGAALNELEDGANGITLNVSQPENPDLVIPELYKQTMAVSFSMSLDGVKRETPAEGTAQLAIPVRVTLPIPNTINPDSLVILHYALDGTPEVLQRPNLYIYREGEQAYVSFVLDHFSDFVMTELAEQGSGDDPVGSEPVSSEPVSSDPVSSEPVSSDPVNPNPTPTKPTPAKPVPTNPKPTDSAPTDPEPVEPEPIDPAKVFTDLKPDGFYVDAVAWALSKNITTGTTATTFSPELACSRKEIVTFLWRAAGSPEPAMTETPFTDVKADAYYYKAVLWAIENGITTGTSATTFAPDAFCTRWQVATFLWRAMGKPETAVTSQFTDVPKNSPYAPAVAWAAEKGITTGTSATTFNPNGICNRGQIVTFLYRAYRV